MDEIVEKLIDKLINRVEIKEIYSSSCSSITSGQSYVDRQKDQLKKEETKVEETRQQLLDYYEKIKQILFKAYVMAKDHKPVKKIEEHLLPFALEESAREQIEAALLALEEQFPHYKLELKDFKVKDKDE